MAAASAKARAPISFSVSRREHETAVIIARRAVLLAAKAGEERWHPFQDVLMDVIATHANGCPLKLASLLAADDFNFSHDVFGIRRHLNRKTGELCGCFVPRFAALERA